MKKRSVLVRFLPKPEKIGFDFVQLSVLEKSNFYTQNRKKTAFFFKKSSITLE